MVTTIKKAVSINPEIEYINNCKIARVISQTDDPFRKKLLIATLTGKKTAFSTIQLTADYQELLDSSITFLDRIVMDAIYTIFISGSDIFTPEMVLRVITGNMEIDVTPHKRDMVCSIIEKLSSVRICIDCTEEMMARKVIRKGLRCSLESYLLPLEKIQVMAGNHLKVMEAYRLIKKPVLYEYTEKVGQFITFPTILLDTKKKGLSDTVEVIQIKRYLIQRIEQMHHDNKLSSKKISYYWIDSKKGKERGLLPTMGFKRQDFSEKEWRKLKSRIHRSVKKVLLHFAEIGYIAGYSIDYEGRQKIKGVIIET